MKNITTQLVLALALTVTGTANASGKMVDTVIATGDKAKAMYDSMESSGRKLYPWDSDETATRVKVQNLTTGGVGPIREGERGILCDKYSSPELIKSFGTEYLCHLVDLSDLK